MKLRHLLRKQRRTAGSARAPQRRLMRLAMLLVVAAAAVAALTPNALAGAFDTTTALQVSPSASIVGAPVTMTATVTGSGIAGPPAGLVTFYDDDGTIGSPATLVPVAGSSTTSTATLVTTELAAGAYTIHAAYGGDLATFTGNGSVSLPVPLTVGGGPSLHGTHVALSVDTVDVATNQPVTLTATVTEDGSAFMPSGTVSFADAGNGNDSPVPLGDATIDERGTATLIVPDFSPGTHKIIASYTGSARDSGSSTTLVLNAYDPTDSRVLTTVTVSASPAAITTDDLVTITAHVVQAGTTTPPAGNNVVLFTSDGPLGNNVLLGQSNALDANGDASLTLGGWLAGEYTITAAYNGNIFARGSAGELKLSVLPAGSPLQVATSLQYTGARTGDYGDSATLSAKLVDASGAPLAGKQVTLSMGSQTCSATTGAEGVATCAITISQQQGTYPISASFAGSGLDLPSGATSTFAVTREQTTVVAGTVGPVLRGSTLTLTGTLLEDGVTPIAGRTLSLTLGSKTCTGVTNTAGVATCTVAGSDDPLGPTAVTVSFAADDFYLAASASGSALLYALADGGGMFVVGDQSAVGAVTFWGAKWSKLNRVSGGAAPDPFKGYALVPPTRCGLRWTTGPGNSPDPPPGPLPAYMAVLVTSSATKSGPSISGTTIHIVIVKTDAGYKDDPGHAGTGMVVATVC
jgi:hypothetical protein